MEYSSFGILHLRIIIIDSRMGVFSTKYIINLNMKNHLVMLPQDYKVES
jgi:hypothetical protein